VRKEGKAISTRPDEPDHTPRTSVLAQPGSPAGPPDGASTEAPFDPLRLCVYTTIAVIAWLITPPAAVVWTSTLALFGYVRAHRAGLTRSRCYLRDVRLVLAYLGLAWLVGMIFTVREIVQLVS
jgi:hypothetical protein